MPVVTLAAPVMIGSQHLAAGVSVDVSDEQASAWVEQGVILNDAPADPADAPADPAAPKGKKKAEA